MATKSKNTNSLTKALIIFLSIITMFGAFQCGMVVTDYADFYGDLTFDAMKGEQQSIIDSPEIRVQSYSLISKAVNCVESNVLSFDELDKLDREDFDDYYTYDDLFSTNTFKYYVVNRKTKKYLTNFDKGDNYKTIVKDKEYAFCTVNDKLTLSPAFKEGDIEYFHEDYDIYCYYNVYPNGSPKADIKADYMGQLIDYGFQLSSKNIRMYTILCATLLLVSLILGIYAMVICGNKDKNGNTKQIFLDYIPVDLHLAITSGLIFGLGVLIVLAADNIGLGYYNKWLTYREWLLYAISACAAGIWMLFIEFMTSFIRVCKSGRKWYKTTLVTLITYIIIKIDIKLFHFYKNHRAKRKERLKEFIGYKPEAFKRRIVLFLVGYGLLNLFFLIMNFVWLYYSTYNYDEAPSIMNAFCWFVMNAVSIVFVTKYVINLDKIITAANNRIEPVVNYDKLPKSLKILVDSIKYSNQELQAAVNKAVKDERMRTELITNVSHDLKTPLTSIINYVGLLKDCDIQDADAKEYISVLDEKGVKLKRLIEDLLEASKATSGVITLNPVFLNLSELATQAIVEHQQEFGENNLELVFKGDKHNVTAYADGNKTFRVIENLLSNARKYSAKGTRVYADVFELNGQSVFEIKNISAEPLDISADELKERFVRGDKSRTNEGNGLGLSIADNLCIAMGGKLDLIIDGDLFKARVILPKN